MRKFYSTFLVLFLAISQAWAIKVETVSSRGGVKAWVVHDPNTAVLSLCFAFRCGSSYDPAGKEGRTALYTRLFLENRQDWRSADFMRQLNMLGADIDVNMNQDYLAFHVKCPSVYADQVMTLITKLLNNVQFEESDFERCRDYLPGDVNITYTKAPVLAEKALLQALFPSHPYGRSVNGSSDGVQSITLADLKDYVTTCFARDRLLISIAGNCDTKMAKKLLETYFDKLPEKSSLSAIPPLPSVPSGQTISIAKHTSQTVVMFGQRAINAPHNDWIPLNLLNYILGGDMTSRLWNKLREEHGLTYGVTTSPIDYDNAGVLIGQFQTEQNKISQALELLKEQWQHIHKQGITARELADAKSYVIGHLSTTLTNSLGIAQLMLQLQMRGHGPNYLEERERKIQSVTLEEVNHLAKTLLDPAQLMIVVVGETQSLQPAAKG